MNSFSLAFSVIAPLFILMSLGYLLRYVNIFNDDFLKQLNKLCFKVFLPTSLFMNIYKSDFEKDFSLKLILFGVCCVFLAFIALMLIVPLIEKDDKNRGVIVQGIFRSNFILFGISVTQYIYGPENTSATAILIAFVVPLFNVLSVIALEIFSKHKTSKKKILNNIGKNPLVIASFFAISLVFLNIQLPPILESTVSDISKIATPLALIVLGGEFVISNIFKYHKQLILTVFGKLILMPLIFLPIAIFLGFKDVEIVAILVMLASPTAVSSHTMAQSANANDTLSSQIVVTTSIFSMFSMFLWISFLANLNLI